MKLRVLLAVPLIVCCYSTFGSAGPAEDLASGRQALEKGELDRAVALLASVAEALPDSFEAQLALGDCYLQLGQLKEALASFRKVLELEPKHARAKRIVAALTAQKARFSDRLTGVRTLMKLRAYASAEEILKRMVVEPLAPEQRSAARLLLAETLLWSGSAPAALRDALQVAQDSRAPQETGPARVLAALALLSEPGIQEEMLTELLGEADKLAPEWSARAALARLSIQSRDASNATVVSARLASLLPHVPEGDFRQTLLNQFTDSLLDAARIATIGGDRESTIAILWPMFSNKKAPEKEAMVQPVALERGWLDTAVIAGKAFAEVSEMLAKVGELSFARSGVDQRLLHYWLAGELTRQAPRSFKQKPASRLVELASKSASTGK